MVTGQAGTLLRHIHRLAGTGPVEGLSDGQLLQRFALHREQEAFAALVRRHGRLVWGVCQHILRSEHDAEDAFQAAFLVLARRAASIRKGEAVGSWLYGVAYRVAMKARRLALKRQDHERRAAPAGHGAEPSDLAWRELQAVLDEELQRLPERYRAPFVLCCLEGRSRQETARELGWKLGTVSSRIAQARRLLQARLGRRGVAVAAALTAGALWQRTAAAAVPAALGTSAVRLAAGQAATAASASALALAEAVMRTTVLRTSARALIVTLGLLAAGAGVWAYHEATVQPAATGQPDDLKPAAEGAAPARADAHGDPLPAEAIARLGTVRFRHGGFINTIAFTPDGKQLVSHGHYDGVRVWDAASGAEVGQVIPDRDGWVGAALLTPDGNTVLTLERGQQHNSAIRLRNRAGMKVVREFEVGQLQSPRLAPDGKLLAGLTENNTTAEVWDVATGKRLRSWKAHEGWVWCYDFSADGKTLVTGGPDKAIRVWDVATGEKKREIAGHPNVVGKLALSADGTFLATLGMTEVKTGNGAYFPWDNLIRVWDVAGGMELHRLTMPVKKGFADHPLGFSNLTFAPDGKTLVTAGQDGALRFWDAAAGKELRCIPLGSRGAMALAFAPDGKTLAVGANAIRLLDVASGKDVLALGGHRCGIFATAAPDGRTVLTAGGEGAVLIWDVATGKERGRLEAHDQPIIAVRPLRDGRRLLTTGMDYAISLWDLTTGKRLRRLDAAYASFGLLAVSADEKTLAVPGKNKDLALIELETGKEVAKLQVHETGITGAAFHPDGRTLLVWCGDHTAHVWDVAAKKELRQFEFVEPPAAPVPPPPAAGRGGRSGWAYVAVASPDGRLVAYGSQSRYLALHDTATGSLLRLLTDLPDGPSALAFSPDGRTLAWGGWRDPAIHLVEVTTGKERHRLDGHKGRITSLAFAADGRTLVSASEDTTAVVWDLTGKTGAKAGPVSAAEFDTGWADLAGGDAARAYQAMRRLTAGQAVAELGKRLNPVPVANEKRLAALIADLDSEQFAARDRATKELEKLGEQAVAACRQALAGRPPAEARRRLERLLDAQEEAQRNPPPERLRELRALEVLEMIGTPEARQVLERLAQGAAGARLTLEAKDGLRRLAGSR